MARILLKNLLKGNVMKKSIYFTSLIILFTIQSSQVYAAERVWKDNETGLTWEVITFDQLYRKIDYKAATKYCDSLGLGNKNNWRIPKRSEINKLEGEKSLNIIKNSPPVIVNSWTATEKSKGDNKRYFYCPQLSIGGEKSKPIYHYNNNAYQYDKHYCNIICVSK